MQPGPKCYIAKQAHELDCLSNPNPSENDPNTDYQQNTRNEGLNLSVGTASAVGRAVNGEIAAIAACITLNQTVTEPFPEVANILEQLVPLEPIMTSVSQAAGATLLPRRCPLSR